MRRLGAALGVEAMALYHHFTNKAELLDAVLDLLLDEVEPSLTGKGGPLSRLRRCFEAVRGLALVHPNAFWVLASRRFRTPRALTFYEHVLGVFREAGFDPASSARYFRLLAGFAVGAGIQEIGSRALQRNATAIILEDFHEPERFPLVTEVAPHLRVEKLGAVFASNMDVLFEALDRHLSARKKPQN